MSMLTEMTVKHGNYIIEKRGIKNRIAQDSIYALLFVIAFVALIVAVVRELWNIIRNQ